MTQATDKYSHLTPGGEVSTHLTQEEACAVLFAHSFGVSNPNLWDVNDVNALYSAIAKLKDQIWP